MKQDGAQNFQRFSYPDYLDIRQQAEVFSDVFAERTTLVGLTADKKGRTAFERVTGNYFSALGVQPALGRLISPSEGQTPAPIRSWSLAIRTGRSVSAATATWWASKWRSTITP